MIDEARHKLVSQVFPEDILPLWCPPLTHYTPDGALDRTRIAAHLQFLSPCVKGLLVPGTTGDGWELTPAEIRELIGLVLEEVRRLDLHLLLGALHPDAAQAQRAIQDALAMLKAHTGATTAEAALQQTHVCGFAICPPRGPDVTQAAMRTALAGILKLNVPLALYQLPQVTQNEMSPELVADLARHYSNFLLFKDTSGTDRVASSGLDFAGVFLVRGMEGDYARWLKIGGGCYDGFLLAGANAFGAPLRDLRDLLAANRRTEAQALSERLSGLITEVFEIVGGLAAGNKFANALKAVDHFYAHGPRAASVPPPRLHAGSCLPADIIRATGDALARYNLMPVKGYLE